MVRTVLNVYIVCFWLLNVCQLYYRMSKSVVIKELDFGPSDKSATSNVDDTSTMSSSAPSTVSSLHPNRTDFQIDLDGFASTNKDVPFLKM